VLLDYGYLYTLVHAPLTYFSRWRCAGIDVDGEQQPRLNSTGRKAFSKNTAKRSMTDKGYTVLKISLTNQTDN